MQKNKMSQRYSYKNLEEWNNKRGRQHVDKCIAHIAFILRLSEEKNNQLHKFEKVREQ